jgi:2-phospho-L-lactate/phosphoenolpyruvate guanylyltransferase
MTNAVLIPVRSMVGAKNRLARELDPAARTRLTLAMLADMIHGARRARSVASVHVVSADLELLEHACRLGAETMLESRVEVSRVPVGAPAARPGAGLNRAVFAAACTLAREGIDRVVTVPGDVPLIAASELDVLVATDAPVVLVPSAGGLGTNALVTAPPDVIVPQFEGESLAAHQRTCASAGVACVVMRLPSFLLDVDTVEDLATLAGCGADRESVRVAADLLACRAHSIPHSPPADQLVTPRSVG